MKKITKSLIVLMLLSLAIVMAGCSGTKGSSTGSEVPAATSYPLTITDDFGNKVTIDKEPTKIVSLAPSSTEIIYAIGAGDKLSGRSEYDNYPEEAKNVTVVGGFTGPNIELITKLDPDVLFDVKGSLTDEQKALLQNTGVKVVSFNPANIDGVYADIKIAGQICNAQVKAKELSDSMQSKRLEILSKIKNVKAKKVFVDLGGFYSAGEGSFIDSMLSELNAENIAAKSGGEWPQLSVENVVNSDPDVYISLYPTMEELKAIPGLSGTNAFKNENVKAISNGTPENDIVQRPGPRVMDGLEIYAKTIYPEAFK
ncbi:MAG: helical backbone metal receptor [Clostridiaceae bacterium]